MTARKSSCLIRLAVHQMRVKCHQHSMQHLFLQLSLPNRMSMLILLQLCNRQGRLRDSHFHWICFSIKVTNKLEMHSLMFSCCLSIESSCLSKNYHFWCPPEYYIVSYRSANLVDSLESLFVLLMGILSRLSLFPFPLIGTNLSSFDVHRTNRQSLR